MGAAWMIRLGALLLVSTPAFARFFKEHLATPTPSSSGMIFCYVSFPELEGLKASLRGAFFLVCLLPSLICTIVTPSRRRDVSTLVAFLPISALLALATPGATSWPAPWMPIPSAVAAAVPVLFAILIAAAWRTGEPPGEVATIARFVIAVDLLWLILLGWNAEGLPPGYLPAWVGVAGSLLVALGELLDRPHMTSAEVHPRSTSPPGTNGLS